MSVFSRLRPLVRLTLLLTSCAIALLLATHPLLATQPPRSDRSVAPLHLATLAERITPSAPTFDLTKGVQKIVLDNGLTVLAKPINTVPVVSVQVWYRIGSRNEAPGVNGIAHQLEHLMFKGTQNRPIQFGRLFSALGSSSNAFTSYDMTAYFGTVEADKLHAMLTLEADRMQNALINETELANEKRVVISELQGYENNPSYRLGRAVMGAAFPDNPYGLPVGGLKSDVEKFTVDQVRHYYTTYYRPDNAVLVVVGNFQLDDLKTWVQDTFGAIPQPKTPLPTVEPFRQQGAAEPPRRPSPAAPLRLREPGSAAFLNTIYPLPSLLHPDVPALQVMDSILSSGRSSRLYQALVERGLASDASGYAAHLQGLGWYEFSVTAVPGKSLEAIARQLQSTIQTLQTQGVTAEELARAKAQLKSSMILDNRDITSQAIQLADDFISSGDYQFTDRLLAQINRVTAADVQRVAQTYLTPPAQTMGWFEPTKIVDNDTEPVTTKTQEKFTPSDPVDPAEVAKYLPPLSTNRPLPLTQPLPETLTLKNGLRMLLLPDRSTPTVTLSGFIDAGTQHDEPQTAGLAALTAENLMNGTKTQSALAIAKTLENRGASLSFGASREGVGISGDALSGDLPVLVQVLADVLQRATFPADELELSRQQTLTDLKLELDNPGRVARRVFQQAVYPVNHPFHVLPTPQSLQAIQRADLVRFYQQHYQPENTQLALIGDFDPGQVRALLAQALGDWQQAATDKPFTVPVVPLPARSQRLTPTLPGKTQAITFMGYNAINRTDPRFYAVQVLNQILGGDTLASRLGAEIRDRQGLTYGIYSGFQAGLHPGPFAIYLQTAPEDSDRAIASTIKLLEQLRTDGVTDTEVATAKRSLISNYAVELAAPDSLIDTALMNTVYGLPLEELRQYTAKIQAVTPAQVNQTIQSLLHPDKLVIVTAGPPTTTTQAPAPLRSPDR